MKVLIHASNGYAFEEYFLPLIFSQNKKWDIDLIISDFYLSKKTFNKISYLKINRFINRYDILPLINGVSFNFYKKIKEILKSDYSIYNMILLSTDFMPADLYLLNHPTRPPNSPIIVVATGTLWRYLSVYQNSSYRTTFPHDISVSKLSHRVIEKIKKDGFYNLLKIIINIFSLKIYSSFYYLYHHIFYPFILINVTFKSNHYDRFACYSGRADGLIVFDEETENAVRYVINKNIYIARHPLKAFDNPFELKDNDDNKKKLLVCFSQNLMDEIKQSLAIRWVDIIHTAGSLCNADEIHLRCHPRTSKNVKWPSFIKTELSRLSNNCLIADSNEQSLIDVLINYCGVIGGPSGSLIAASTYRDDLFVVSVPNNSSQSADDQHWIMGSAYGIAVLNENEQIKSKHIEQVKSTTINFRLLEDVIECIYKKKNKSL